MKEGLSWRDYDWLLLGLSLTIAVLGVIEIYSATRNTVWTDAHLKQILWIVIGLGLVWALSTVDYHWLVEQSMAFYLLAVAGLAAVLVFGPLTNGARRWLPIGDVLNLQVSEFAKVMLVLVVARLFSELQGEQLTLKVFAKAALIFGLPMLLVVRQPDLSTALTYLPILAIGVLLAGLRWRHLLLALLAVALITPLMWSAMPNYQRDRLTAFLNPEEDPRGKGYQSLQSKIAVGSGGIWGRGFARGSQTQLRFLPEAHTDFIFASYAEESGFVGVAIVLTLYFAVLMKIVNNAQTAPDPSGMFLCMGVAALLLFHVTVNVGMVVSKMPVTGMPLPLMSYGGSHMLTVFMLLGLVNNVRLHRFTN